MNGRREEAPVRLTGRASPLSCVLIKTNLYLFFSLGARVCGADGMTERTRILTLINWGLASLTVAMRHTLSSKADWSDRWITPSKLFRVQLGTGDKHTQTRREIRSGETRLGRTSGTFRRHSPLFRDLKFPMNLTYSYTGGSLGSMVPLSMWQQNSSWFFAGVKKSKDENPGLQDDGRDATPAVEGELYFSDIRASASLLPWCGRTEPCTRLSAPRLARSSAGSGPRDQTERRKAAADKL